MRALVVVVVVVGCSDPQLHSTQQAIAGDAEYRCAPDEGYVCPSENEHCDRTTNRCVPGCEDDTCRWESGMYCDKTSDAPIEWTCRPGCTQASNNCPLGTLCRIPEGNEVGSCEPGCYSDTGCALGMICTADSPFIDTDNDPNPRPSPGQCVAGCRPCVREYLPPRAVFPSSGRACSDANTCERWQNNVFVDPIMRHRGCPQGTWCGDAGQCVPGSCETAQDCESGEMCVNNECIAVDADTPQCNDDADCGLLALDCRDWGHLCDKRTHRCQDFFSYAETDGGNNPGIPGAIRMFTDNGICAPENLRPLTSWRDYCSDANGQQVNERTNHVVELALDNACALAEPTSRVVDCRQWCGAGTQGSCAEGQDGGYCNCWPNVFRRDGGSDGLTLGCSIEYTVGSLAERTCRSDQELGWHGNACYEGRLAIYDEVATPCTNEFTTPNRARGVNCHDACVAAGNCDGFCIAEPYTCGTRQIESARCECIPICS